MKHCSHLLAFPTVIETLAFMWPHEPERPFTIARLNSIGCMMRDQSTEEKTFVGSDEFLVLRLL